ncbi:hypothetical protein N627_0127 [Levilactobacillus brevis]|nr:hypothetical protein N627_0127 [Levilactobacillus brevis]
MLSSNDWCLGDTCFTTRLAAKTLFAENQNNGALANVW